MQKIPIVCLMGPTASGKTQLAVELVKCFPFEIISVDSAMVYRGMDIGTAKPTGDILQVAPHHLIDIRDPADPYSAADFKKDALEKITDILSREKIPLLVGGTMLYFQALQKGLANLPSADPIIRDELIAEAQKTGWPDLHTKLNRIDPVAASRIHPHDAQRIQRALEVFMVSGKPISEWQKSNVAEVEDFQFFNLGLMPFDREVLHNRIEQRFEIMLDAGFVSEVEQLFKRSDLNLETPAIRSVGYRQIWQYLAGDFDYTTMKEKSIVATRQLAKRQLTWLRHGFLIQFFDSEAKNLWDHIINSLNFLKK